LNKNTDNEKIYSLLLQLKEEVTRLSLQVRALKNELKGVKTGG
jgi:hypothetical protein